MKREWMWTGGVVLAVIFAWSAGEARFAGAAPAAPGGQGLPEGVTSEMVEEGRDIFLGDGLCFTCHGDEGEGTMLGPPLADAEWIHIDGSYDALLEIVESGVLEPVEFDMIMAPRGGGAITDEQVRAVAAYVWTISRGT